MYEERAGAFHDRGRIDPVDRSGCRWFLAPARRRKDGRNDTHGHNERGRASAPLPRQHVPSPPSDSHVAHRKLQILIALVSIVFERKREVQRRPVLGDELLALDGPPRNRAENAAVLLERHLQMLLLEAPWTIDDFNPLRLEQRTRIAGAERRQERHFSGEIAVDVAESQTSVDSQTRLEIVRSQQVIGMVRDRLAELADVRRRHRQTGRLLVPAEPREMGGGVFECGQHIKTTDASARPVREIAVDRDDDHGPVKDVDQLGCDDANDAAVPAIACHDEDAARANGRIGFHDLARAGSEWPTPPPAS